MFNSPLTDVTASAYTSSLEGSHILTLLRAFEARWNALLAVLYRLSNSYSPFPFEVTLVALVLGYIAIRQVALWYRLDIPVEHAYVYWKLQDVITRDFYLTFEQEHHMCTAILVYVTQKLWRVKPLTAAEVRSKSFMINLLSLYCKRECDDEDDDDYFESEEDLSFRKNEKLMVPVKLPIYPFWTPTHQDGVEMCTWMSTLRLKNCSPEAYRSVFLRVRKGETSGGGAAADATLWRFVKDALNFYFDNGYCDQENSALRMYRTTAKAGGVMVQSVPLPLGPTLDTVFFPRREHVKALLERFTEKKGRYAIQGFPHKLGFLLYGPRGTGKRSFVRALAYHTQRHIVRIPLSSLSRNAQLFSIFHFEEVLPGSTKEWALLSTRKVIFLLEDVDTNCDLLRARDHTRVVRTCPSRGLRSRDLSNVVGEDGETKEFVAVDPAAQDRGTDRLCQKGAIFVEQKTPQGPLPMATSKELGFQGLLGLHESQMDTLNLSALLNVLDGAVEAPEQIVVMIADHPERLDPALLRPGRLSTHLRFDFIEMEDLLHLCGLFFGVEGCVPYGALSTAGTSNNEKQGGHKSLGRMQPCAPTPPQELCDEPTGIGKCFGHGALLSTTRALKGRSNDDSRPVQPPRQAHTPNIEERVYRQLSMQQAAQVRSCIAALEDEEASSQGSGRLHGTTYNFLITPSQVHHLCMRAVDLNDFLEALCAYIRNGGGGRTRGRTSCRLSGIASVF
ncbi:hypothetical protein JKF63_00867 [Porcisia hertigi]|uniref:ATPase AAA-type core domain-containing protein n=1 Tax=Porcisia hertigi TaxID=2761500 RepID=A0A836L1F9_9TRYP|nr:hypothetical protein JKF63_00867 [Porcisia hertigi]